MQNKQKKCRITRQTSNMSGYKYLPPRGGKNRGTMRYRPNGFRASDPPMTDRQRSDFGCRVQEPADELWAMVMYDDIQCNQFDWDDWVEIEQAAESRRIFEENRKIKSENAALKAENEALKAELAHLKQQQQNQSPNTSDVFQKTPYKDAVTISPATIQLRRIDNFLRRVRLFFLLLDYFNQIIKHLCNFQDCEDGDVEIEGCGSVLRKIFEMFTSTSAADISENTLTIPDLDYKFYGSKAEFEEFAAKVSLWITTNKLNIPGTHFMIGKMRRFTARKPMSNHGTAEYEKFTLEVIDSATKQIFMIDIMDFDGSTVFPCDFTVNSFAVSPKGIFVKDPSPIHMNPKNNDFLAALHDISCRRTTCMTRKIEWNYDDFSLSFLIRGFKMIQAGYQMHNAPIIEASDCLIMGEDPLCVNLTGCNCSKQKDRNGKPIPLPIVLSIYSAIGIYENGKRCPNCRHQLSKFVCLPERSKQEVRDPFDFIPFRDIPQKPMSKSDFDLFMEKSAKMSQGYQFTGFNDLSEQSEDALSRLAQFSRRFMSSEERDAEAQILASSARGGGGVAAPVLASSARGGGGAAAPALASSARGGGGAAAPALASSARGGGGAASPALASLARGGGGVAAPVLASLARGGGGAAAPALAAPARRPQYYYDSSDSDEDDFIRYIQRGS